MCALTVRLCAELLTGGVLGDGAGRCAWFAGQDGAGVEFCVRSLICSVSARLCPRSGGDAASWLEQNER